MSLSKDKILVVGGYGRVGAIVVKILVAIFPGRVIIAGRSKVKAQQLINDLSIQAYAKEIDLGENEFSEIEFEEIHTAICCIEYLQNENFIHSCIKYKVNYTELATSYEAYQRLAGYSERVEKSGICLIPGVGLMPGLSGVFVKNAFSNLNEIPKVESFVLLGLGEDHGVDAIRWMMEYAAKSFSVNIENEKKMVSSFANPKNEQLLNENRPRKFYRFNFGDQHIITSSMNVGEAHTMLAFDSQLITRLIAQLKKLGLLIWFTKINPKTIKKFLSLFKLGSERYAIQTHCYGKGRNEIIYLAEGLSEAYGTGVIAAYTVLQLYQSDVSGFKRLEEFIQFDEFIRFLKVHQISIKIRYNENDNFRITRK